MISKTPEHEKSKPGPAGYPAEKARQGRFILKRRWQRIVFIAGLTAIVLLAIALPFLWARESAAERLQLVFKGSEGTFRVYGFATDECQ